MKKIFALMIILGLLSAFSVTANAEVPQTIDSAITLEADENWQGDFWVNTDMDLNGYTLTIKGNLIQSKKSININNGKLIVKGDYRIQALDNKSKGIDYSSLTEENFKFCNAVLKMDNEKDYVLIEGNFYPNNSNNVLRNGTLEVKGDFMVNTNAYFGCYVAQGKHKTIFSGDRDQKIFISRVGSYFNIFGIQKKSGKLILESPLDIKAIDEDTVIPVGGNGYIYLYLYNNKSLSLAGHKLTIDGNLILDRGSLILDGGSLTVTKDLRTQGISKVEDKISLDYNQLVKEDFKVTSSDAQLIMKNPKDYVLIEGNFFSNSYAEAVGLRDGVLELKGDFTQAANTPKKFIAYDKHKTILSGDKKQLISFQYPSYINNQSKLHLCNNFNILEIKNKDVFLSTPKDSYATKAIALHWANEIIPFELNVRLNEKDVKFAKYRPLVINGIIYFELGETNKLLSSKLAYDPKKSAVSVKSGSKLISVKSTVLNKANYIPIEALLKQMSIKFKYDGEISTLSITK